MPKMQNCVSVAHYAKKCLFVDLMKDGQESQCLHWSRTKNMNMYMAISDFPRGGPCGRLGKVAVFQRS